MYTDCSGLVYSCYLAVTGKNIGTWTGNQWNQGTKVTEGYGTIDESLLQPGDLVFFTWPGGSVSNYDHVEMYKGSGDTIGHGGPMNGPIVKSLATNVAGAYHVMVRRHA
jgi:cell wall-associated NlpC family hydrolase